MRKFPPQTLKAALGSPVAVTLAVCVLLVGGVLAANAWDPLSLAHIGTRFSEGDPQGTEGYDGQFVYFIARDPTPQAAAAFLDVPAYRYQRILLPLLARWVSLGNSQVIPWAIPLLVITFHGLGVWAVSRLLEHFGVSRWYALVYGLWAGFLLAVRLDLSEPVAYGLAALGVYLVISGREKAAWVVLGTAIFAKETTALYLAAAMMVYLWNREWSKLFFSAAAVLPFLLFQVWLWAVFGAPGVGSGGAMATPFELIPFMGLLRIYPFSPVAFFAFFTVFGPSVVLPSLVGAYRSLVSWLRHHRTDILTAALFLNSLIMFFVPFSTYREPGGLLRFACGLVLAWLLFWARERRKRVLNYSVFWLALNVFLINT